jgi:hypothetical protein
MSKAFSLWRSILIFCENKILNFVHLLFPFLLSGLAINQSIIIPMSAPTLKERLLQRVSAEKYSSDDDEEGYYSDDEEEWELEKQELIKGIKTLLPIIFKVLGSVLAARRMHALMHN